MFTASTVSAPGLFVLMMTGTDNRVFTDGHHHRGIEILRNPLLLLAHFNVHRWTSEKGRWRLMGGGKQWQDWREEFTGQWDRWIYSGNLDTTARAVPPNYTTVQTHANPEYKLYLLCKLAAYWNHRTNGVLLALRQVERGRGCVELWCVRGVYIARDQPVFTMGQLLIFRPAIAIELHWNWQFFKYYFPTFPLRLVFFPPFIFRKNRGTAVEKVPVKPSRLFGKTRKSGGKPGLFPGTRITCSWEISVDKNDESPSADHKKVV